MINYELAKELKDAGFPQNHQFEERAFSSEICIKCGCDGEKEHGNLRPCVPTLPELIDACGDGFFSLGRDGSGKWRVNLERKLGEEYRTDIDDTPEEAVAKLWLLLNA